MKLADKKLVASLSATAFLMGGMGAALAAVSVGDTLGTSEEAIRAALTSQGYTVEEFEMENGELEAEVIKDGQELEIVIDAASGIILEMELEDDDDGEDDDDDKDDN